MRKMSVILLVLVMMLACSAPVLAAANPSELSVKPALKLKVVNEAETSVVTFIAQLSNIRLNPVADQTAELVIADPIVIDFYTGSPLVNVYPNQYLGSAKIDKNGVAKLRVYQKPGEYAGGAIWARTPWGKVYSNTVVYKVPAVKPQLKLEVFVDSAVENYTSAAKPKDNVTYKASLLNSLLTDPVLSSQEAAQISRKVDFYTGSSNSKFPDKYIGSAELDRSGVAKISFYQAAGQYSGGAIYVLTNTGDKIYSNVVPYKISPVEEQTLPIKSITTKSLTTASPETTNKASSVENTTSTVKSVSNNDLIKAKQPAVFNGNVSAMKKVEPSAGVIFAKEAE